MKKTSERVSFSYLVSNDKEDTNVEITGFGNKDLEDLREMFLEFLWRLTFTYVEDVIIVKKSSSMGESKTQLDKTDKNKIDSFNETNECFDES